MNVEPRRILITGADGLLGWHAQCRLFASAGWKAIPCNREQFNDSSWLSLAVAQSDAIFHFAGINRGLDSELELGNPAMASQLIAACLTADARPHVLFSSSSHVDRDTPYGRGKLRAAELLTDWAEREDARFCNFVLPHVFGEHGRPFYNSAVSTFGWQLANGQTPVVQNDARLDLLHTSQVVDLFLEALEEGAFGTIRPKGHEISVSQVLRTLTELAERYQQGVIPNLDRSFDLHLFNCYRSYLPNDRRTLSLALKSDHRGWLFEALKSDGPGQVFVSTTAPGITRGNHFHFRKVERFLVLDGTATIRLRRMLTRETIEYQVSGERPTAIDIPTLHTHNITNTGDSPLTTLFWCNEHFDPNDSDTFACDVSDVSLRQPK